MASNTSTDKKEKKERRKKKRKRKTTQAAKSSSHQLRKRDHLGRKAPSPEKHQRIIMRQWLLAAVDDLNKLTVVIQETSCGAIYAVARCLTISCQVFISKTSIMLMNIKQCPPYKTCIMLINIQCWMGIGQLLCSYLSMLNRDVPSPLCCSPSTWTTFNVKLTV